MLGYISLVVAVIAAVGMSLIYLVFSTNIDSSCTNCTGNCNQGRSCDCKDIE